VSSKHAVQTALDRALASARATLDAAAAGR
jgi:hypothetical protein